VIGVTRSAIEVDDSTTAGAQPDEHAAGRAAFEDLYRAEWRALVGLGWSLTGSWAAAEELAQDAFADAYRRWDEISRLDRPGAWVRRAVVNRAASLGRRRAVERRGVVRLTERARAETDGPHDDRTGEAGADGVADPAFWAAVRALPDRQRACVALHYLEERPVREIAEIVGCGTATVKVHLHRGRQALAARLARLDDRTAPPPHDRPTGSPTGPTGPTVPTEEVER
jgi:RNA polymerase sigma-70 factor (ECF subfamily)